MAMKMDLQSSPGGPFVPLNLTTLGVCHVKLRIGYSHPMALEFDCYAPQQSFPLGVRNFIRFWDDTGSNVNGFFSSANPLFEGFIEQVTPGDSTNIVHMVCYDPTYECAAMFAVMSLPWQLTDPPLRGVGAIPRAVFNSMIDNDDDYAYELGDWYTMGQMMQTIFDDQQAPLQYFNACPSPGVPYNIAQLDLLTYVPQEKMVFESEGVRSAMERMLRWEPAWRLLWTPGTRLWQFGDITLCPPVTITINDFHANNPYKVLHFELDRSLEGRATAVAFFGPPTLQQETPTWSAGGLTKIASGMLLQNNIATCCNVEGLNQFQITAVANRNVARLLQTPIDAQYDDYYFETTESPTFFGYWPATGAGAAGWRAITGWRLDARLGIVTFGSGNYIYRYNPKPAPGAPNYEDPTDVQFTYATFVETVQTRYPVSGFGGTAYTVANMANELLLYDEMLAVGYEYGQPVTIASRLAQFNYLAQRYWAFHKDIIYTGGCVLRGMVYDFCLLSKCVNFTGLDGAGNQIVTGWENINAMLTDVEYDFDQQITTLQFSSDQMELIGIDPELWKQKLKIHALVRVDYADVTMQTTLRNPSISDAVQPFMPHSTMQTTFNVDAGHVYVDPMTLDPMRGMPGHNAPVDPSSTNFSPYSFGHTIVGVGDQSAFSGPGMTTAPHYLASASQMNAASQQNMFPGLLPSAEGLIGGNPQVMMGGGTGATSVPDSFGQPDQGTQGNWRHGGQQMIDALSTFNLGQITQVTNPFGVVNPNMPQNPNGN